MRFGPGFLHAAQLVAWNPADSGAGIVLTNNNLTAATSTTGAKLVRATESRNAGKYYIEIHVVNDAGSTGLGIAQSNAAVSGFVGGATESWGWYSNGTQLLHNNTTVANPSDYASGDTIMIAVDLDNLFFYFGKNGAWQGSQNPNAGTGGYSIIPGSWFPAATPYDSGSNVTANFGATAFAYPKPTGFLPWQS